MANVNDRLNQHHKRRLNVTCRHIDRLLSDVEDVLRASTSKSAFPMYVFDMTPVQRRMIEDHIAQIRARLVQILRSQGIAIESPSIPASRALHTAVTFVDIAIEELRPRHMRGYGEVPPAAAAELNGIVRELEGLVHQLNTMMTAGKELPDC